MTTPTSSRTDAAAKKDVTKLQRAIIDGLEDVKAHDIQVFDTERLSPLFERVVIATGSSNRQTKALAASVRDAVREAGFGKPRSEGEDNGEWIIVDCGAAVVHIMQPAIRQYYNLEELWGETPVRLKLGAPKPAPKIEAEEVEPKRKAAKTAAKTPAKTAAKASPKKISPADAKKAAKARRELEKPIAPQRPVLSPEAPILSIPEQPSRRSVAKKVAAAKAAAPSERNSPAPATPAKSAKRQAAAVPAKKTATKAVVVKTTAVPSKKVVVGKPPAKKPAAKKTAATAAPARAKPAAKKTVARKSA